jgi:hypothetical protein
LLVHAVARGEPAARRTEGVGVRSGALRWVRGGEVGAWATAWEGARPELAREELFAHHRLVEELGTCLPVRFGTWVTDEAALAGLLREREGELLGALRRVEGRRELAVTALWRGPAAPEPSSAGVGAGPGRRFLEERRTTWRARARREARARELAARLTDALALPGEAVQHRLCPSAAVALSSAFLVPADRAAALRDRLVGVGEGFPEVRLLVHGPWPPYSFVGTVGGER